MALKKKQNNDSRVFVILGDGECDEGSVWEAAASASHYGLGNLIAVIDANVLQYDGNTESVMKMSPFVDKWKSFGWDAIEINGHDTREVFDAFLEQHETPLVIIAHTIKGKGVSYMEGNKQYHNARISREQYEIAIRELEVEL